VILALSIVTSFRDNATLRIDPTEFHRPVLDAFRCRSYASQPLASF